MSDTPLFQNSDAQEAVYGGNPQPDAANRDAALDGPPLVVPAGGVLGGGLAGATGPGAGTAGTGLPATAGAELATDTDDATPGSTRTPGPAALDDLDDTAPRG
jgi:hypothetical protein